MWKFNDWARTKVISNLLQWAMEFPLRRISKHSTTVAVQIFCIPFIPDIHYCWTWFILSHISSRHIFRRYFLLHSAVQCRCKPRTYVTVAAANTVIAKIDNVDNDLFEFLYLLIFDILYSQYMNFLDGSQRARMHFTGDRACPLRSKSLSIYAHIRVLAKCI